MHLLSEVADGFIEYKLGLGEFIFLHACNSFHDADDDLDIAGEAVLLWTFLDSAGILLGLVDIIFREIYIIFFEVGERIDEADDASDVRAEVFGAVSLVVGEAEDDGIGVVASQLTQDEFEDDVRYTFDHLLEFLWAEGLLFFVDDWVIKGVHW
jgi:hypothetical protein